jgi:hypothetical protein
MKHLAYFTCGLITAVLLIPFANAQTFVYPAQGQSDEQMEKDKFACYQWAAKESGYDPMQAPQASQPQQAASGSGSSAGRGAARGAAIGAVGGAIADNNVGRSAAIGAAVGGGVGAARRNQQQQAQLQQQQASAEQQAQQRANYDRAYGVCLEGRGYTVK